MPQPEDNKKALIELIKEEALLVRGEGEEPFTLSSGVQSRYYLDIRKLTLSASSLYLILYEFSALFTKLTNEGMEKATALGGPCVGADPIVGGLLALTGMSGTGCRGFLVRKEEKTHGAGKSRIIGSVQPGDRCILFEDVVTTSRTTLDAIKQVEDFGAKVIAIAAVVDRMKGTWKNTFAERGMPFYALLTAADLGIEE